MATSESTPCGTAANDADDHNEEHDDEDEDNDEESRADIEEDADEGDPSQCEEVGVAAVEQDDEQVVGVVLDESDANDGIEADRNTAGSEPDSRNDGRSRSNKAADRRVSEQLEQDSTGSPSSSRRRAAASAVRELEWRLRRLLTPWHGESCGDEALLSLAPRGEGGALPAAVALETEEEGGGDDDDAIEAPNVWMWNLHRRPCLSGLAS